MGLLLRGDDFLIGLLFRACMFMDLLMSSLRCVRYFFVVGS